MVAHRAVGPYGVGIGQSISTTNRTSIGTPIKAVHWRIGRLVVKKGASERQATSPSTQNDRSKKVCRPGNVNPLRLNK